MDTKHLKSDAFTTVWHSLWELIRAAVAGVLQEWCCPTLIWCRMRAAQQSWVVYAAFLSCCTRCFPLVKGPRFRQIHYPDYSTKTPSFCNGCCACFSIVLLKNAKCSLKKCCLDDSICCSTACAYGTNEPQYHQTCRLLNSHLAFLCGW